LVSLLVQPADDHESHCLKSYGGTVHNKRSRFGDGNAHGAGSMKDLSWGTAEEILLRTTQVPLAKLQAHTAALRHAGHRRRLSYSRKVFIPLTKACRDVCHYCEFVPLPFVPMEAPIFAKGKSRGGPTLRECILMHAVSRLVLNPLVVNIQPLGSSSELAA
jgi:2-iminoacetate synthase ThiH